VVARAWRASEYTPLGPAWLRLAEAFRKAWADDTLRNTQGGRREVLQRFFRQDAALSSLEEPGFTEKRMPDGSSFLLVHPQDPGDATALVLPLGRERSGSHGYYRTTAAGTALASLVAPCVVRRRGEDWTEVEVEAIGEWQ
jgi:hypothetical protein